MMPSLVTFFLIVNFGEKVIENNVSSIMDWIPQLYKKNKEWRWKDGHIHKKGAKGTTLSKD
jgi:hypothetical protein